MKEQHNRWMSAVLALAASISLVSAKEVTLRVGDAAPKIANGDWVQGEPVKDFENGKAYIVEFWATWCGPCRASIPHLNEIYKKYKDKNLIVVGQDCWERDEKLVAPFLKEMGEKMTYRVALDDKKTSKTGTMAETWMAAAGRSGIPSAFLVDTKGKIAWIGHPMTLTDSFIEKVLAGELDITKAATDYEDNRVKEEHKSELSKKLNTSIKKKNWAEAQSALTELEKITPKEQRASLEISRVQILLGQGNHDAAVKAANEASDAQLDNIFVQSNLSGAIGNRPEATPEDLDLAVKFASRANDAAKGKNAFLLASLAQLSFKQGKKDKAVEYQQQAVDLAEGKYKETLEKTLLSYK